MPCQGAVEEDGLRVGALLRLRRPHGRRGGTLYAGMQGGARFRPMATLAIKLLGKSLRNPIMNASGTLGYGREIEPLWGIETLGAYVTKGLSLKPHHGNPTPRVWEERRGMINSIGLQNVGVERFFSWHFSFFKEKKTPIIVNFFGFTEEEYIQCAQAIKPHSLILALEMNLSCPNIKKGGISFGKDAETVFRLVKEVKARTTIPVIPKLTPEVKNIVEIASAARDAGADGLTIMNTMPAAAVDIERGVVAFKGGLSGPLLRPVALRAVHEVSTKVPLPVIGVGGIMDAADVVSFLVAGAQAVQVGTATFVDPFAIPRIVRDLEEYLRARELPGVDGLMADTHG
jgi:dihydroorotate dehydrogenase (NAD+) catalytic subunit